MPKYRKATKGPFKKNSVQQQQYKAFIATSGISSEPTVPSSNNMLLGSNEYQKNNDSSVRPEDAVKKTPIRYRIIDWGKKHIIPAVIATIITACLTAIVSTVITHKVKIAVLTQRIEYIETEIQTLKTDSVTKESLTSQVEIIRLEMSKEFSLKSNDFEWRIKAIEDYIDSFEQDVP